MISENAENLDCYDLARTSKSFQTKVYGIKVCLHDYINRKTYIVACIVDDIMLSCMNCDYITKGLAQLELEKPKDPDFNKEWWDRFVNSLTAKELLVYNVSEIHNKYMGVMNQLVLIKQKTISQVVKEFLNCELYGQRTILIQLLIRGNENEFQFLSYLLYDLLSNETNGHVDTLEQTLLYDSLPWNIKKYFRSAMKQTIQYTNNLYNFDNNKIPLEQQICLLKATDNIKEKAILKLKEIKAKTEDSGTKARQYLDGLLKIPFSIVREEQILTIMDENQQLISGILQKITENDQYPLSIELPSKLRYTNRETLRLIETIRQNYIGNILSSSLTGMKTNILQLKKDQILSLNTFINNLIKNNNLNYPKLSYSGKKVGEIQQAISSFITAEANNPIVIDSLATNFSQILKSNNHVEYISHLNKDMNILEKNVVHVGEYMEQVTNSLNAAVYGHEKAKRQVERIIGQWINGEKSGYCFGFEGPPGVGKTSLAKRGIAHCLKDHLGDERPFAFIAVGGSANGSTLEGHNYTYVGSTWGRIVDILIETKCMNPIIFIDELDKISRTEHGRELIGILTHLIDPTQNDAFQDKYFSGIDLDLSKALFIFSYNDVDCIDRILLDRIHRISFKHLSLEEKMVITQNYILPEIYKKMGLDNVVFMSTKVIEFIIHTYTNESGVRKLKEILFEIMGEINLSQLVCDDMTTQDKLEITIEEIKYKYLKDRPEHKIKTIHSEHRVGVMSGLWANGVGQGGLLPIEARFLPSTTFLDLKLTGMQGDVMKESMHVARTLAWNLLDDNKRTSLLESFDKTKCQGIHVHVPEGATPKDGPSGGGAITTVIYSLLSNRRINRTFAMTGEICLQGKITAIGGLDLKILGGINSGVTNFIYPKDNEKDFKDFENNLKDKSLLMNIKFHQVGTIAEVFDLIFID
jgi:ATP-dependent Lon protease